MKKKAVVLVVEDDFIIRMGAMDIVSSAGHAALEACGSEEAINILSSRDDINLVFTDVIMPGKIDGLQLAFYVHRQFPKVGIIVASGTLVVQMNTLPPGARFFTKPYSEQEIAAEMAAMLQAC